jgi:hypothetical protein
LDQEAINMEKLTSPLALIWLLMCGLGGLMLGALLVRVTAPLSTPEPLAQVPDGLKLSMALGGIAGALVITVVGAFTTALDARLGELSAGGMLWSAARIAESIAGGALAVGLLSLVVVIGDYHEVLVAMLDFHGAPIALGALLGGALGAIRGVAVSDLNPLWLALLTGLGLSVCGGAAGLALGLGVAWALTQYVVRGMGR